MANDPHDDIAPPGDSSPIHRGNPWAAWCVIVAVASWVTWHHSQPDPHAKKIVENRLLDAVTDWQARYLVGAARMFQQHDGGQLAAAARVDTGPVEQRLRNVVVTGEISGAKAAAQKLKTLETALDETEATADDRDTADALRKLYDDLVADKPTLPSLEPADRKRLIDRLGWSGNLALHPAGGPDGEVREELLAGARQTLVRSFALFIAVGVLALGGMGALVTILVLLLARPASRALGPPTQHGGIYAETFAVWIALYMALSYGAAWLPVGHYQFLLSAAVMFASLAALGWPVMRGVAWQVVRDDVGLRLGRWPLVEVLLGPVAYLAAMPLVIVGVMIVAALLAMKRGLAGDAGGEFGPDGLPSHPIVGWLLEADWWQRIQLVFLASVMAPLVEETMFRGVLYRHLRDATSRLGYVGSVLISALAVSFVFAAIHPQGWVAIPALMALAIAFTLAREWRGTLLPAMLAHGINNFLVTCLLLSLG